MAPEKDIGDLQEEDPPQRAPRLRLLLVDDHTLFGESLLALLAMRAPELDIQYAERLDSSILSALSNGEFDLILADLRMPEVGSVRELDAAFQRRGQTPLVIISGTARKADVDAAISLGLAGFIPKTMAGQSLVRAIMLIASGERFFPLSVLSKTDEDTGMPPLSDRERMVLEMLCKGASNKSIARALNIEEASTKAVVRSLCAKFAAENRTEVVVKALELGFL
jgi:two-component system nitrate/nitrite response regulator NarL